MGEVLITTPRGQMPCYLAEPPGSEPRPGEIRRMRITEAHDYDVVGTLLPPTEPAPQFAPAPLIHISPALV